MATPASRFLFRNSYSHIKKQIQIILWIIIISNSIIQPAKSNPKNTHSSTNTAIWHTDSLWSQPISTYSWKSYFQEYTNSHIISRLKEFRVHEIFVTPGHDEDLKISSFMELANQEGIAVARLLGENSYVQKDNGFPSLEAKMQTFKQAGFKKIHFDIEPQALPDYKENIELYTERFNSLILLSQQWCTINEMELSLSIPMHTQPSTADLIANLGIKAYIMAYENPDQQKLLNRTAALRQTLNGQYVWVIRAKDFTSSAHICEALTYLRSQNITAVGIYDMSQMETQFGSSL